MPPSHRTITSTLAPLVALALSATACAEIEPLETTGVYELVSQSTGQTSCEPGDEARLLEAGADLVGPHFAISFLCHFSGSSVPDEVVEAAEELADLPTLVTGAELLINQIAFAPTYEPEATGGSVTAWIEAGDQLIDLNALPLSGSIFAVNVPAGEDAVLWVEDEGRAQGLDFRTGAQIDAAAAYYNGIGLGTVETDGFAYEEISVLNRSDAYRLTCSSGWGEVTRNVWSPDHGWAEDGTVFVTVDLRWCDDFEDILRWELDQKASVTIDGGDGPLPPVDWTQYDADNDRLGIRAVFEAPAASAELTVAFTPVGNLKNLSGGEDFAFVDTPETTDWQVSF